MARNRYFLGAMLCVLVGSGAALTQEPTRLGINDLPKLTIDVNRSGVILRGAVSSVAHESILRQRALELFADKTRTFDLQQQSALPPGWALVSETTLRAVAESYSSTTEISASNISISGFTSRSSAWRKRVTQLEGYLLPGMRLEHEMVQIGSPDSIEKQCIALFRSSLRDRKIEFPRSGSSLGPNASPLLDKLIQIASDCPAAHISITGHTDSSGEQSSNVVLSQARADAVAAYMTERGLMPARFTTGGVGSTQPISSGNTARDDRLNRRIDIALEFPGG